MENIYIITTKEVNSKIASADFDYTINLMEEDDYFKLIMRDGAIFSQISEKVADECELLGVKSKKSFCLFLINTPGLLEEFKIFSKGKKDQFYDLSKKRGYNRVDMLDAIVDFSYIGDEKSKKRFKLLFSTIRKIKDTNIYITHNWHNSGEFNVDVGNDYRYEFIETITSIIKQSLNKEEDREFCLALHDKDMIHDVNRLIDENDVKGLGCEKYRNLYTCICKNKVYLFQHSDTRAFYNTIIHNENINSLEKEMVKFFFTEEPEIVTNDADCLKVNLDYDCKDKKHYDLRDIITDIANFQSNTQVENTIFKKYIDKNYLPIVVKSKLSLLSEEESNEQDLISIDKRALFLDSSIWIQYVQSESEINLSDTKLYKSNNAKEVRDFNAKLCLLELKNLDEEDKGSHNKFITPFPFHSETKMKKLANDTLNGNEEKKIKGISNHFELCKQKRRILLVDDNADSTECGKVHKFNVIKSILEGEFNVINVTDGENNKSENKEKPTLYIEYVKSIDDAVKRLSQKRFDTILLDYLLDFKDKENEAKGREYGTDFLSIISGTKGGYKNSLNKTHQGPLGKYWIFFISAFSNAISEKMLSEGMHYNEEYWHIARGACPTTTPGLFRYNLYSLFLRQFQELTDIKLKIQEEDKIITLIDLLFYLFKDYSLTRSKAMKGFNSLLHLRAHYDILKGDYYMGGKETDAAKGNGSPLVQALFPDLAYYTNAIWEHIQHLIYLVAYGNIRQWNEMWDEYIFIKDILKKVDEEVNKSSKNSDRRSINQLIEGYIYEIKSANY